ncbi:MAG: LysM peptidoglycan-binding domain-containing protein [Acidobacteriota bacterium]
MGQQWPDEGEPTVDQVIARAQGEFDAGLEMLHAGDEDQAREHFDRAVEAFINSGIPLHGDTKLREAFDQMLDDIAALEADVFEAQGEGGPSEPVPAEKLGAIEPSLSPDHAERSREEVEPETHEISFDIPMVVNDKVLAWIDIFQHNAVFRKSFEGGFERYGLYEPMIHRILREEGLPSDLIYMAFLESTYKINAYSRARAKGIWQFMTSTARQYGLRVDRYVDERSDPEKSTRAAARYMKDLYATFGDWHLAIAAYNTGAGNIKRAQRRSHRKSFWRIAKTRYMMRETKNFVPAILALALMSKDPAKYGFGHLRHLDPLRFDRVPVEGPIRLTTVAKLAGVSQKQLRMLNPQLRRRVTPPGYAQYEVKVPQGHGERFKAAYARLPRSEKIAKLDTIHRVRRGETLAMIAARYGTSVRQLAAANHIRNPNRIRVGARLTVPRGGGYSTRTIRRNLVNGRYHRVRRGDTLSGIASAYGVPLRQVFAWNGMNRRTVLRPGMRIKVKADRPERWADSSHPYHVVRRGDTLSGLSRRYQVPLSDLYAWNGLNKRSVLRPGMKVAVTRPEDQAATAQSRKVMYRVRRGDNLFRIARRYGTTVENLKAWNDIPSDTIHAGEVLTIYAH